MAIFNEKTGKYVPNPFHDPAKREELWQRGRNGVRITKEDLIKELLEKKAARDREKNKREG